MEGRQARAGTVDNMPGPNIITIRDGVEYPKVVAAVLRGGSSRTARGMATRDYGQTIVHIQNPVRTLPSGLGRNLSRGIAAIEAVQLIAGMSRPDLVLRVAPQFERYMDDSLPPSQQRFFHGAYGTRIALQAACVVDKLTKDPETRQAVITLWDPWQDNLPDRHDYPCTISLGFQLMWHQTFETPCLMMNVLMRSNDVWLGFPYDIFQFSQLQRCIANALEWGVGPYYHTAWSLHLYERDIEQASAFLDIHHNDGVGVANAARSTYHPLGIGRPGTSFSEIMNRARAILENDLADPTESEKWFLEAIHRDPS